MLDLPKKYAGRIQKMDSDVEDGQATLLMKVGLGTIDVKTRSKGDASPTQVAEFATGEDRPYLSHGDLEAQILVNRESYARLPSRVYDSHRVEPRRG
jgi:hypothetical protein